ncbi:hypothetical protein SUGI_0538580 [Cryptomeria japonica]|nr:hypothetical protein SUGI_0538580 [Cryptomeria japonica]
MQNNIWSSASFCSRIFLIYFNTINKYTNFPNRVTSNTGYSTLTILLGYFSGVYTEWLTRTVILIHDSIH